MSVPAVALEPAGQDAIGYVEALLERTGLPTRDVRAHPEWFYVGRDGDDRVGIGGIEPYGRVGLLRSVVVEPALRERGYGNALCAALEAEARATGIEELYLLTTTAAGFFAGRGYERLDRADAPGSIRETSEFAELCPATAACLRTEL
jgi:amino-acid N-acetyltransferase